MRRANSSPPKWFSDRTSWLTPCFTPVELKNKRAHRRHMQTVEAFFVSKSQDPFPPLEMWGGLECTVNRVGDRFLDQLELSGHANRLDDLDRFAELGISAIRYPVLWERTAPGGPATADWTWSDLRLNRLQELNVRPIVGLVHHGSGPRGTDLLDPRFPALLAQYAGSVAARYPWINDYTPVNEPLTTARFSALYGHWYPHRRDEGAFFRAVLTQCQGIAAAMRAIRAINPDAQLIQTEDLGEVFARPALAAQADYENERRWLSLDLLNGHLVPGHPLWEPLLDSGIAEAELRALSEEPCIPDVIGINHYVTSERLLDERLERYPQSTHGGNGRQIYADIEAVRVCVDGPGGWRRLLECASRRYGRPVAATEVHLGSSREEQLRWLAETWNTANELRSEGIDIRAVTAWSLLGAFGWNSLVTRDGGDYEPGVFDLQSPTPRPTALAHMVADLAAGRELSHPLLATPGWWRRPSRLLYPPVDQWGNDAEVVAEPEQPAGVSGLLLAGSHSTLTDAFTTATTARALPCQHLDVRMSSDWVADVSSAVVSSRPWAVILSMSPSELSQEDIVAVARSCSDAGIPILYCSNPEARGVITTNAELDLLGLPEDPAHSLVRLELAILGVQPQTVAVRGGLPQVPVSDRYQAGQSHSDRRHQGMQSEGLYDLASECLDLLIDRAWGIWKVVGRVGINVSHSAFTDWIADEQPARRAS